MALSANRDTPMYGQGGDVFVFDHGASVTIYRGALLALDASGNAVPATTATGLVILGRAETSTADDAAKVRVRRGIFRFKNSAAGDAIAKTEFGANVYVVDDETVAKTSATNTRSIAGKCRGVDTAGVWVEIA